MPEHILLRNRDIPDIDQLEVYLEDGGFEAFHRVVREHTPQEIIDMVKTSNLRGRGGAGFPAGVKWSFLTPVLIDMAIVPDKFKLEEDDD